MAKKDQMAESEQRVTLGLRATPQQRAWMIAAAKARGLSLQGYFEDIMRNQADSPWRPAEQQMLSVTRGITEGVRLLEEIYTDDQGGKRMWLVAMNTLRAIRDTLKNEKTTGKP